MNKTAFKKNKVSGIKPKAKFKKIDEAALATTGKPFNYNKWEDTNVNFEKIDMEQFALLKPSLVQKSRNSGKFTQSLLNLAVNEALKINLTDWHKNRKTSPSVLANGSPAIKRMNFKFESMKSKDGLYTYLVRVQ